MASSNKTSRNILLKYSFLFPLMMAGCHIISAQEIKKNEAKLSEKEWKAVEGIFKDPGNNERNVEFVAKENMLMAKLLWNNAEIQFTPESALGFVSTQPVEGELLHIQFLKDSMGAISMVKLSKIGIWNRARDYKPIVKKEMEHTPGQLKPFEGLYQLQNEKERFIEFKVKENRLVLKQQWDGNEISFVPETTVDFFSKEAPLFSLKFSKDVFGNITDVIAFKRDLWVKVNKSLPSAAQLKACEGKYQLIGDPDNFIQITAKNAQLMMKQLWDGKEMIFEMKTENFFYNEEQSLPLLIIKDDSGAVVQVKLLGNNLFNKVK